MGFNWKPDEVVGAALAPKLNGLVVEATGAGAAAATGALPNENDTGVVLVATGAADGAAPNMKGCVGAGVVVAAADGFPNMNG